VGVRVHGDRGEEPDDGADADGKGEPGGPGRQRDQQGEQRDERCSRDDGRHEGDLHDPPVVDPLWIRSLDAGRHVRGLPPVHLAPTGFALAPELVRPRECDEPGMTSVRDLQSKCGEEPITMLTAYDAVTAELADAAGVDVLLVGDSMGNAVLGYDSTLPVTVDEVAARTGAVARGAEEALVVADMPFLSFGHDLAEGVENAGRMLKEEGANAVKIESGSHTIELTERLTEMGVPVVAHVGLTPQSVNQTGYVQQGHDPDEAREIFDLAVAHEEAGAFACVLEHIPANLAAQITDDLAIPTIGIGAGPDCDGQVLVYTDAVGLSDWTPPFAESFGDVRPAMAEAMAAFVAAVEDGEFPSEEHSHVADELDDIY